MIEEWRPITSCPDGYYEVSNLGRVKSLGRDTHNGRCFKNEKMMSPATDNKGYLVVTLITNDGQKSCKVHRMVAKAFIKNPYKKPYINHLNNIKNDNRVENLEWCTPKENSRHAIRTGACDNTGEKNIITRLTENDVKRMYIMRESGLSVTTIAWFVDYSFGGTSRILHGHTFRKTWLDWNVKPAIKNH